MPVTFAVSSVAPGEIRLNDEQTPVGPLHRLSNLLPKDMPEISQSSITEEEQRVLIPQSNGFVHSVLQAYGAHHHLVIRPDDVWIAILTQLSFYVNAHAEELRTYFVAHKGKRTLTVAAVGTRHTIDFGLLARAMTREIHMNVVDSTLVDWILPDFTTTSLKDTTICSVIMMSTLEAYFGIRVLLTCGIPTVTLEGTKDDWQRILKRIERLYDLGDQPSAWANMLYPILRRFVSAFDGKPDTEFWNHVVHRQRVFCVQNVLSGWLTAFCVWTEEGEWRGGALSPRLNMPRPPPTVIGSGERLDSEDRATLDQHEEGSEEANAKATISRQSVLTIGKHSASYALDGIRYSSIEIKNIPSGCCDVDVTVDDQGQQFLCTMTAGHVASVATAKDPGGPLDTLAPAPQWFIIEKETS